MVYAFTNRRRAKDAVLAVAEQGGVDGISILVREGIVYVGVDFTLPELSGIMHFGEPCVVTMDQLMDGSMEEFYRRDGVSRFRV